MSENFNILRCIGVACGIGLHGSTVWNPADDVACLQGLYIRFLAVGSPVDIHGGFIERRGNIITDLGKGGAFCRIGRKIGSNVNIRGIQFYQMDAAFRFQLCNVSVLDVGAVDGRMGQGLYGGSECYVLRLERVIPDDKRDINTPNLGTILILADLHPRGDVIGNPCAISQTGKIEFLHCAVSDFEIIYDLPCARSVKRQRNEH